MYQFSPRPAESSRIVLTVQLGRIYGERHAINLGSPPSRIQDIEKQRAERVQGRTPKVITNWGIITFPSPFAFPRKARRRGCSFPLFAGGEFSVKNDHCPCKLKMLYGLKGPGGCRGRLLGKRQGGDGILGPRCARWRQRRRGGRGAGGGVESSRRHLAPCRPVAAAAAPAAPSAPQPPALR